MTLRWLIASLHLLGLALSFASVWARGRALAGRVDADALRRALAADSVWGISAIVSIGTGLYRAFGGIEKGTTYYVQNHWFLAKMGLLALILALEVWPMITLIRWRVAGARGQPVDLTGAPRIALISVIQALLLIGMVFAATAMARGLGVVAR
jgi:putative membrane protein